MKRTVVLFVVIILNMGCITEVIDVEESSSSFLNHDRLRACGGDAKNIYYWAGGEKVYLTAVPDKYWVIFDESVSMWQATCSSVLYPFKKSAQPSSYFQSNVNGDILKEYRNSIVYSAPIVKDHNGNELGITNIFYVKLKRIQDIALLQDFAAETGTKILSDSFLSLWYMLSCSQDSSGNALELSNRAYESGLFAAVDLELSGDIHIQAVSYNDPLYTSQWNLSGIYGINYLSI